MAARAPHPKLELRYYDIPEKEPLLALTGPQWANEYDLPFEGYLHFHNYMEVGICYYGSGYLQLGNQRVPYNCPNDGAIHALCVIPAPVPHHTLSDPGTIAYWEWFYIDLGRYLREMYGADIRKMDQMMGLFYNNARFFLREEQPILTMVMEQIRREMTEQRPHYRTLTANWVRILIIELCRIYEPQDAQTETREMSNRIQPAIRYMEAHFAEQVKIGDVANACGFSESHFRRIFQEIMNMKPVDYLNMIRIRHSTEMLRHTDKSMSDIAYSCGFDNVSTFNRNFRRLYGTSPYQWKKSDQNPDRQTRKMTISAQKGWQETKSSKMTSE